VHGDSHYFRIDKPFLNSKGQRLENFTRVETFGDNQANGTNDVNWLKVLVDPASREVFAYQPQIVPANRTPPLKRAAGDKSDLGRSAPSRANVLPPSFPATKGGTLSVQRGRYPWVFSADFSLDTGLATRL